MNLLNRLGLKSGMLPIYKEQLEGYGTIYTVIQLKANGCCFLLLPFNAFTLQEERQGINLYSIATQHSIRNFQTAVKV